MSTQTEWATDLFTACDELGYSVHELAYDSVKVSTAKGPVITIAGALLSGALIRRTLLPDRDTLSARERLADAEGSPHP